MNVNDTYFQGAYKEIWKHYIPSELSAKESNFIYDFFELNSTTKVLDLMAGYGRHAIPLASKGVKVTAVDNLAEYTNEISKASSDAGLDIKVICHDVLTLPVEEQFDLALCMGNSFNFYSPTDVRKLLALVSSSLKRGGHILINSWTIAEIVMKSFMSNGWEDVEKYRVLHSAKFLFQPSRIETTTHIILPDTSVETKLAIDYVYSLNEITQMFDEVGIQFVSADSVPGKKKFTLGDPRVYIIGKKR